MKHALKSSCCVLALTMGAMPLSGYAQDAADEDSDARGPMERIIVTTTRRETDVLSTAGSISVLDGSILETEGISSAAMFDNLVPNMRIQNQQNQGMGAVQISLRGIVNSSFIEIGDPNVGFHVDGVYMSRPQSTLNLLFDAERIEIARGPQGTLYGRNSTVGSINVVNNRPDATDFAFHAGAEYGNYDNKIVNGVVNIPIIKGKVAVRAAGFWQERDTYFDLRDDDVLVLPQGLTLDDSPYRNEFGDGLGDDGAGALDHNSYRVSLNITPIDEFSAYVSYESTDNESPVAPQSVRQDPYTAYLSNPHFTDQTIETIRAEVRGEIAGLVEVKGVFGDQNYFHQMMVDLDAGTSRYSPERVSPLPTDNLTFEQTFFDRAWETDARSYEATVSSVYESRLQWILGYFNFEEDTFRNFWIDLPTNNSGIINFNQPSRVAKSEAFFGRLDWDVTDEIHVSFGLRHTDDTRRDTGVNRFSSFPGDGSIDKYGTPVFVERAGASDLEFLCSANLPVGPCNGAAPLSVPVMGLAGGIRVPGLNDGFAAATGSPIGQVDAGIAALTAPGATVFTDAITTDEQLRAISALLSQGEEAVLIGAAGSFPRVFFTEQKFDYVDWQITVDWTPREGTFLYGTVSTGHKAGSQEIFFHPRLHQFINSIIKPEKLISYEVGWKEEFENIGDGLNVSAAFFFMDYQDKQQSVFVDGGDLFCADTFGDFNGDGLLESFVAGLDFVPIFAVSAVNAQNGIVQPDGQVALTDDQIAAAIQNCSQGSTDAGGPLADQPGMPNFLELMQVNFGNATVAGFEFEYVWNMTPVDRLSGYFTVNVLNEINNPNPDALPFDLNDSLACSDRVGGCPDITATDGNELPFAPDITFRAAYEHDFIFDFGVFTAGADLTYNSSYWLSIWNTDCYTSVRLGVEVCDNGDRQKGFALLDLRLRYTHASQKFYIEGYATNVTGTTYATGNLRPTNEDSVTPFTFNTPRFYGVRAVINL